MNISQPSRHERRRLQTRKRLIEAAMQLVLEKGYDAISIQDITDRADLGRGTFYIHFKDKEEIVWIAFRELFQTLEQEAHKQLDRNMPGVEYYGLLNIFRHAEKNRDLYRVVLSEKSFAMLTVRVQDFLAEALLYDIRNAPPADVALNIPPEITAQILTGIISHLLFWWLRTANDYTAEQMAAMIYKVLYRQDPPS
jgi:AcrR family transcriptional regulator